MPERPRDLDQFERILEAQLLAAGERRYGRRRSALRRRTGLVLVAAAVVVLVLPAALVVGSGDTPVAAEPFEFVHGPQSVTVSVVDAVIDPHEAERQLEELGVDATVEFAATSPSLEGQLVRIDGLPDGVSVDREAGRIRSFTVPSSYAGELRIALGRPAEPGEAYEIAGPHQECARLVGADVTDVGAEAADLADRVRWEVLDRTGRLVERRGDPPTSGVIADLVPISDEEVIVVVSPDGEVFAETC